MSSIKSLAVRSALVGSVVFDVYCLYKTIPLGLGGDPAMKPWFIAFFAGISVSIILGVLYSVTSVPRQADLNQIETETLAALGLRLQQKADNENSSDKNDQLK